jgi:hypothetical protein
MIYKTLIVIALYLLFDFFGPFKKVSPENSTAEKNSPVSGVNIDQPEPTHHLLPNSELAQRNNAGVKTGKRRAAADVSRSLALSDSAVNPKISLEDNWNLAPSGLPADTIFPFFSHKQAAKIVFFRDTDTQIILPEEKEILSYEGRLYISTAERVERTRQERLAQAEKAQQEGTGSAAPGAEGENVTDKSISPDEADRESGKKQLIRLNENDFEVVNVLFGHRDNGAPFTPFKTDYWASLQGPDFPFQTDDTTGTEKLLTTVLTLGHGGSVLLKVKYDGFILNKDGFDFSIFENAFRIAGTNLIFQEFALVGVSEKYDPGSFKWFSCDPDKNMLAGSAGAVPTSEGGDQFDLSAVNLQRAKYIWIKDIGNNKNRPSKWPTEGVDLDAVRLHNAFKVE